MAVFHQSKVQVWSRAVPCITGEPYDVSGLQMVAGADSDAGEVSVNHVMAIRSVEEDAIAQTSTVNDLAHDAIGDSM